MSSFAVLRGAKEENDMDMPDIDESKLERAMGMLAKGAENMDEEDPRQAANLMRQLSDMTGLDMGPGMEEALKRMEAGEDPEKIEAEMGDLLEEEPPFELRSKRGVRPKRGLPFKDDTLYELWRSVSIHEAVELVEIPNNKSQMTNQYMILKKEHLV